ncbi:RNA polymerase sigma-70 factor [Flavobacterium seoulense]|uniref:RNA polymerase subunit sigma-24 n=1 Tax=Flavobacterium seoulense TaxID=1492738 RepID=A0A066WJK3_9FLAO|nr:RNA polymerase sigma-70 factor [Flavobacterium seoulense]KDN54197.1 RNA polymerase subunit sigma-24 [Flavobacterium seoulense]
MIIKNDLESIHFESFKKGDQGAFAYFYDCYFKKIQAFSISFIYDKEEAENVTQEAFLHLWENRDTIESINGITSFLYTYTKSKCLNIIRHNKVKDRFKDDILNQKEKELDTEILNSISFDTLEISELEHLINGSISNLPPKTREVFIKKRFEQKKNVEIAEEMQVTLKAVEAHMTKALKLLRNSLSDYLTLILLFIYNN